MRVVSYNIKSCMAGGIDEVARTIAAAGADVVGLQEVDRGTERANGADQAAELAARAGMPHAHFCPATPWPGGGEYGVALLSAHPCESLRRWLLYVPTGPEAHPSLTEPRVVLSATLRLPEVRRVRVFVTHFGLDDAQRGVQAREVAAAAQQAGVEAPVVLLGDLNAPPEAEVLQPLLATLHDAHANVPHHERGTFPAGVPLAEAAVTDYVLVPPGTPVQAASVIPDARGASDHNLCLADLDPAALAPM